jgi:hypothetical protein
MSVENGLGEKLNYTHVDLDETILDVSMSPQSGNYRHLNDERSKDAMSFMAVFLDNPPEKNDIIVYNNIEWKVELFDGTNPYDILCYRKTKGINRRPSK